MAQAGHNERSAQLVETRLRFRGYYGQDHRAAIEVHNQLGPGFQEITYQRALARELAALSLDFSREVDVPVYYKGQKIDTRRVDFVVEDCIVEIKARKELLPEDLMQTLSYLKASGYRTALLINFGSKKAEFKRFVNSKGGEL